MYARFVTTMVLSRTRLISVVLNGILVDAQFAVRRNVPDL